MGDAQYIAFPIISERPGSRELLIKNGIDGPHQCSRWVREDEGIRLSEAQLRSMGLIK